jgi:hypothetical protein
LNKNKYAAFTLTRADYQKISFSAKCVQKESWNEINRELIACLAGLERVTYAFGEFVVIRKFINFKDLRRKYGTV